MSVDLAGQIITFALDTSTRIQIEDVDSDAACEDLVGLIGARVRVEAEQLADDTLLADRVKVNDDDDDEDSDDDEVEFEGTVVSTDCPDSINVERTDGQTVIVSLTATTVLEGVLDCADLAGRRVEVEGVLVDGVFVATKIEVEDDDDSDDNDSDDGSDDDDESSDDDSGEDELSVEGTVVATDCPDSITVERADGTSVVVSLTGDDRARRHPRLRGSRRPPGRDQGDPRRRSLRRNQDRARG